MFFIASPSPKNNVTFSGKADLITIASLEGQFETTECPIAVTQTTHTYRNPLLTMQVAS